jgi:hypothetical protein
MTGLPSRRAAAIVLAAAVGTGAVAGVSAALANVEVPGLLVAAPSTPDLAEPSLSPTPPKLAPSRSLSTPSPSPPRPVVAAPESDQPEPFAAPEPRKPEPRKPAPAKTSPSPEAEAEPVAPTEFIEVDFGLPEPDGLGGGSTNRAEVPKGWDVVGKGIQWRDFHDPTDNLNLRIRDTELGESDLDAANKARAEREKAEGYTELSFEEFSYESFGQTKTGVEYRFAWTGSEGTRYGVERYFEGGNALVGGYGWEGQLELVEPAVDRAVRTYVSGGD